MVFCNEDREWELRIRYEVTILILIDGFLQFKQVKRHIIINNVTILILIDGFLQLVIVKVN